MKRFRIIPGLFLLVILAACAFQPSTLQTNYPKMYQNPPASILILPPINNSTAVEAKEYFACSLAEAIGRKGYYSFPVEAVFSVLRDEGLYDTETLTPLVISNLRKYFGADAVLVSTINRWDKIWWGTSGSLTIDADFALLSTSNADTLWNISARTKVRLDSQSDNLLGKMIESAIKTALEDYFPNSHKANLETMSRSLPFGKHHPKFATDAGNSISPFKKVYIEINK